MSNDDPSCRGEAPETVEMQACIAVALEDHPEVLEAYLFGSQARGDAGPASDIDVAVFLDREQKSTGSFGAAATIAADVIAALGRNDVDLVIINDAPPLLYHRVLKDGVRILARDLMKTTIREGRALSRYFDYLPQLAIMARAQKIRIESREFGK